MRIQQLRPIKKPQSVSMNLWRLIERVNDLPADAKSAEAMRRRAEELNGGAIKAIAAELGRPLLLIWPAEDDNRAITTLEAFHTIFYWQIDQLGPSAREYVGILDAENETLATMIFEAERDVPDESTWRGAERRYDRLLLTREILERIAGREAGPWRFEVWIQTDELGKIVLNDLDGLDALLGVEANRIRKCPVCGRIFWPSRKDAKGCTAGCAKILRFRRWKKNYPEKYKLTRLKVTATSDSQ